MSELVGDWARLEVWRGRLKKSSAKMSERSEGDSQDGDAMEGVVRGVMKAVSMGGRLETGLGVGLEGDIQSVGGRSGWRGVAVEVLVVVVFVGGVLTVVGAAPLFSARRMASSHWPNWGKPDSDEAATALASNDGWRLLSRP